MYHAVPTSVAAGVGGATAGAVGLGVVSILYTVLAVYALLALGMALYRAARTFRTH